MSLQSLENEIIQEIRSANYLCLICHSEITPESHIFSCHNCYRVYDVRCIRQWAKKSESESNSGTWKCPYCSFKFSSKKRAVYRCWCGKTKDPDGNRLIPHSCGQTCGAKRNCPHPCPKSCHPGPHEEVCASMGPPVSCHCGKKVHQSPCVSTPYRGWSCRQKCGAVRPCGHSCDKRCHKKGKCGPCKVGIQKSCAGCGVSVKLRCADVSPSARPAPDDQHISCGSPCTAKLTCGNHQCSGKMCGHDGDHECPLQPSQTERCPCGKVPVTQLLNGAGRQTCMDPIPRCKNICDKLQPCGHSCQSVCHDGECSPCQVVIRSSCRCSGKNISHPCQSPQPHCQSKCGAILSCGKHKCRRLCCPLKQVSSTRRNGMEFADYTATNHTDFDGHICDRICGKRLPCGQHDCTDPCHLGPCSPCRVSSAEDVSCACGFTVIMAPIRCGTPLPNCTQSCSLPRTCGHPQRHTCHSADEPCPPCKHINTVKCPCGKSTALSQCSESLESIKVSCAIPCGTKLGCGHICTKRCCTTDHSQGVSNSCDQKCGKPLSCGHGCQKPCHIGAGDMNCRPCAQALVAECPCGNLKAAYECGESLEIGCNNDSCLKEQYSPVLIKAYGTNPRWCRETETIFREFIADSTKSVLRFNPMRRPERKFVHYLAEHCNMKSQSLDRGTNRSVRVLRLPETFLPCVRLQRGAQFLTRLKKIMPQPAAPIKSDSPERDTGSKAREILDDSGWATITGSTSKVMPEVETQPKVALSFYDVLS